MKDRIMNISKSKIYTLSLINMLKLIDLSFLHNKSILITGAYGMIGSCLIDALILWNKNIKNPCTVIALGRNFDLARERFNDYWQLPYFKFVEQNVCNESFEFSLNIDYIIHAASNADPVSISKYPVDTLLSNFIGTNNLLKYGINHKMKRFMFISSGEMYGQSDDKLDGFNENYSGYLDYANPRSCYPAGKRAAEVLCQSYIKEYGIDAVIARPCHIFGPTMTEKDTRAVSEFLKSAVKGKKIVLKSDGMIERSHCYVIDAVLGILTILKYGKCGEAYNIANKEYKMTIREFANKVAIISNCEVEFKVPNNIEKEGYSKVRRAVLNSNKLEKLGWKLDENTNKIYETIEILKELL